jgi:ATP-dependent DNA helicase RecG
MNRERLRGTTESHLRSQPAKQPAVSAESIHTSVPEPPDQELRFLKGVGPRRAAEFERAGLHTVDDLLHRFPIRFEDRSRLRRSADLKPGESAALCGEVVSAELRRTRRRGFSLFEMLVRDDDGIFLVIWMNQPFLQDVFAPGQRVMLFGKVEWRVPGGLRLENPQYELVGDGDEDNGLHTGRIVPVYERIGSLTSKQLRRFVHDGLRRLPPVMEDPLPVDLLRRHRWPGRRDALWDAHFPTSETPVDLLNRFRAPAQVRLIFEELFLFQLGLALRRRTRMAKRKPHVIKIDDAVRRAVLSVLPFRLTDGQRTALREIVEDMCLSRPMNRLLQGDVGCGKTIVALLAALVAMENGQQVAFMAPTELLAEQHSLSIGALLAGSRFRVVTLTGSVGAKARRDAVAAVKSGDAKLVVGTHALVQREVRFQQLGLAVIDEQHRFGVLQRSTLREKGRLPDVLVMTATPIPRTLALTSYSDLDVSVIRDLPPGRRPVKTKVEVESRREAVYEFVRRRLQEGRQVYVVYPLVEESAKIDLRAATEMSETLATLFPDQVVGLLHGRMKQDARDAMMQRFAAGEVQLLVATTVIEVGVDVPNATVMVVEHAERFGLAQLHQLRGRVGRGSHQSYCRLLHQGQLSEMARQRLKAVAGTTDGFEIAEYDLLLRGPGEMLGTRQSGIPTLRVAHLVRDHQLMETARQTAIDTLRDEGEMGAWLERLGESWARRFGLAGVD